MFFNHQKHLPGHRIAYLNTQYPSLSHTFIEREVRAVRALGIEVHTFSIRQPREMDQLSDVHAAAVANTYYILARPSELLGAFLWSLVCHPFCIAAAIASSQRLSPPGIRARLRHLIYVAEAAKLACEMGKRGLRHVHVHMANNGAAVAKLATVIDCRLSYSLSIHGSAEFFHVDSWCLKAKVEGAMFVRCISEFCRSQVMAWASPNVWHRLHIVHCGVDGAVFRPRAAHDSGPLRILTVGRLDPIKGYPLLLQACAKLLDRGVEWTLDMVGDGPMRESLVQQAHELNLADRIKFSGAVGQDDIQRHFDQADVMVVCSFMEGIPVVLMEAMAKALAVIATSVGGIPELIDQNVNGILVTPGSVDALADALEELAKDRVKMGTMGEAARRKIIRDFDAAQSGRQMVELLSRYCAQRQPQELQNALPQGTVMLVADTTERG
jgi:glycosyltransferase involved in cell wall biosynthesis